METLEFDFGTTPEEVIRERVAEIADTMGPRDECWCWIGIGVDNLLTVLRSLKRSALELMESNALQPIDTDEGRLRIEILAALGINES